MYNVTRPCVHQCARITRCPAGYGTVRDIKGTRRRRSRLNYIPRCSARPSIDFPARRLRCRVTRFPRNANHRLLDRVFLCTPGNPAAPVRAARIVRAASSFLKPFSLTCSYLNFVLITGPRFSSPKSRDFGASGLFVAFGR